MARRMSRKLVAMSSSAIAAIYFAGYLATQGGDAGLAGTQDSVTRRMPIRSMIAAAKGHTAQKG